MPTKTQIFQVNVSFNGIRCNHFVNVDAVGSLKENAQYARTIARSKIRNTARQEATVNFVKLSHEVVDGYMIDNLNQRFVA